MLFYSRSWVEKNEVELARKVEIEKADILAAGELGQIRFWPSPDFEERTFSSCGICARGDLDVFIRGT